MVLAICWDESHLKYNVKHSDPSTKGIAGIKPSIHRKTLNGVNYNSLYACYRIYKSVNYNLKKYKGTKRNYTSVTRTLKYYKIISNRGIVKNHPTTK